jgi:hypothetical protein
LWNVADAGAGNIVRHLNLGLEQLDRSGNETGAEASKSATQKLLRQCKVLLRGILQQTFALTEEPKQNGVLKCNAANRREHSFVQSKRLQSE